MNSLRGIASLVRWKNLGIILATQIVFYFLFLLPALRQEGFRAVLSITDSLLFLSVSLLIAGGGNTINDLLDEQADRRNGRNPIRQESISRSGAWTVYWLMNGFAILISGYLALKYQRGYAFLIVPGAIVALWFYSYRLKQMPLVGNALISAMCGAVVWVLFLPDLDAWGLSLVVGEPPRYAWLAAVFGLFASCANFLREWVKDLEDRAGDTAEGARTLAVLLPVRVSKRVLQSMILLWMAVMAAGLFHLPFGFEAHIRWISMTFLIFPLIAMILLIEKAGSESGWNKVSCAMKAYMGLGLILACILRII